jgi:hypothetical protein
MIIIIIIMIMIIYCLLLMIIDDYHLVLNSQGVQNDDQTKHAVQALPLSTQGAHTYTHTQHTPRTTHNTHNTHI